MTFHTPNMEAQIDASSTPAGASKPTHTSGTARRGSEFGDRFARMFESYHRRKRFRISGKTVMAALFWACIAIGTVSITAQLTGHTQTLRSMWHETP